MAKLVTLENPDGTVATRGGFGPCALASLVVLAETGIETPFNSVKAARDLLDATPEAKIDAARELGLKHIRDVLAPAQNPGATARIEDMELPGRRFRNAWRRTGGNKVEVDMPTARAIRTDEIRVERDTRIRAASIDHQNADIAGDTAGKQDAARRINDLRDLPETIQPDLEALTTPEELEAYEPNWPE